jgi:hypothetical protein
MPRRHPGFVAFWFAAVKCREIGGRWLQALLHCGVMNSRRISDAAAN